jgi:hypothetical protein
MLQPQRHLMLRCRGRRLCVATNSLVELRRGAGLKQLHIE